MSFTIAIAAKLEDAAERVRRNVMQMIRELQSVRISRGRLFLDVELPNAINTPLNHGLGRLAVLHLSPPRHGTSTGRIAEVRATGTDVGQTSVLLATGWGATITVDVWAY